MQHEPPEAGANLLADYSEAQSDMDLRISILRNGVRLPAALPIDVKEPRRVRSGSCGGLDLVLPSGKWVNAPVSESFARISQYELAAQGTKGTLTDRSSGATIPVQLTQAPNYYQFNAASGRPMAEVGQLCSDRVGIGITNRCTYWAHAAKRCQFCSIGLNAHAGAEVRDKRTSEIAEVVKAAVTDSTNPARHILLGGGTPSTQDAGASRIAEASRVIRQRGIGVPIYAMLTPPRDAFWLRELHASGVDELGMNIEVFSDGAARQYIPGKHREIGIERYLKALEKAVEIFGPVNARSIMVIGLEPLEDALRGVRSLAERGVMPILSPLRPMVGTPLENHARWPTQKLREFAVAAAEVADKYGVPLGPTCIPCQANTLIVSEHPAYRFY